MKINEQSILIVDDVPKNIQLLGSILKEEAYDLEFATSGKEALEWLDSKQFDLVLLDIMMPEMDGFEVCRRIKENPATREVSVIFLTAKADFQSIIQGFESGAVDYITKPYNRKELLVRVKTHLTMQQQRKQLELTTSFEKKIFSIIGHDLRSPMGNIRTYIDAFLMVNTLVDDSIKNLLKDLYLLSDNAFNLLENLLNWAKSQSGGIVCRPQPENVVTLIRSVKSLFSLQAENKKISLTYTGDDFVEGFFDPELISVVIRNLVSNALKFTPHEGRVNISAGLVMENSSKKLILKVSDTGTGMSPDIIDNLMNKNIHYTTYGTDNEKGSGLGFQLCKEFVALNNGKIWIESSPSKGSTFFVVLQADGPVE
ncbi:MAG TPA: hybrid sensor histidine kinase/response regulator [Bacteroidales bacterium]|nr:hybrid sensor histidine kinase/response regulator [Bacteroidales bacterium]